MQTGITAPEKPFFKNLDGLRFIAFFSVFLFHSFYTPYEYVKGHWLFKAAHFVTRHGNMGVNFFFVLSGFLITYLLCDEYGKTGTIHLRSFYLRRILRIWPLYFLMLFIGFVIYPYVRSVLGDHSGAETANPWLFLIFLSNFDNIRAGSSTPTLYILWSISVEEQFYLLWPVLMRGQP